MYVDPFLRRSLSFGVLIAIRLVLRLKACLLMATLQVEPCCWMTYTTHRDTQATLAILDRTTRHTDALTVKRDGAAEVPAPGQDVAPLATAAALPAASASRTTARL